MRTAVFKYADLAHPVERHLPKVDVAGSSPVIRSSREPRRAGRARGFFVCLNKVLASVPASFLVPGFSVTPDPICFLGSALFFVLLPDRLTRRFFQFLSGGHIPGAACVRAFCIKKTTR